MRRVSHVGCSDQFIRRCVVVYTSSVLLTDEHSCHCHCVDFEASNRVSGVARQLVVAFICLLFVHFPYINSYVDIVCVVQFLSIYSFSLKHRSQFFFPGMNRWHFFNIVHLMLGAGF